MTFNDNCWDETSQKDKIKTALDPLVKLNTESAMRFAAQLDAYSDNAPHSLFIIRRPNRLAPFTEDGVLDMTDLDYWSTGVLQVASASIRDQILHSRTVSELLMLLEVLQTKSASSLSGDVWQKLCLGVLSGQYGYAPKLELLPTHHLTIRSAARKYGGPGRGGAKSTYYKVSKQDWIQTQSPHQDPDPGTEDSQPPSKRRRGGSSTKPIVLNPVKHLSNVIAGRPREDELYQPPDRFHPLFDACTTIVDPDDGQRLACFQASTDPMHTAKIPAGVKAAQKIWGAELVPKPIFVIMGPRQATPVSMIVSEDDFKVWQESFDCYYLEIDPKQIVPKGFGAGIAELTTVSN